MNVVVEERSLSSIILHLQQPTRTVTKTKEEGKIPKEKCMPACHGNAYPVWKEQTTNSWAASRLPRLFMHCRVYSCNKRKTAWVFEVCEVRRGVQKKKERRGTRRSFSILGDVARSFAGRCRFLASGGGKTEEKREVILQAS